MCCLVEHEYVQCHERTISALADAFGPLRTHQRY